MESQGNSLFSEVEDQRAKTASELRVLEETYRSKIHRFDDLEKELEQKRNENNELHFKGTFTSVEFRKRFKSPPVSPVKLKTNAW